VPAGVHARNPAFDVTPANLIAAIFTERGTIEPVSESSLSKISATHIVI
jgi:methylthioribose-1-phosphate isomerase